LQRELVNFGASVTDAQKERQGMRIRGKREGVKGKERPVFSLYL
jgi:hypothetical protein